MHNNNSGKSERGTTVYAGMRRDGGLVAITEWRFVAKLDKKGKELKSIDTGAGDAITLDNALKQVWEHCFQLSVN